MSRSNRREFLGVMSLAASTALFPGAASLYADAQNIEIGKPYRGWQEGEMDIHHIYTGIGESVFHIFPDGTSMLVDAGDRPYMKYKDNVTPLPNATTHSGEWIARYIKRVNPGKDQVDYMMISHFHEDHMGDVNYHAGQTKDRDENYFLTGITQVGEFIHFKKGFDRGFPYYRKPVPVKNATLDNYRKFIAWKMKTDSLSMEPFKVGRRDQIKLLKNKTKYASMFCVQNICGNGEVWTGDGEETQSFFDLYPNNKKPVISENPLSIGVLIGYGPFRYYTAGDVSGKLVDDAGNDIGLEEWGGAGVGPVDVCKANHHAYKDAMTPGFVKNVQANVYVMCVWDNLHIQDNTMTNMTSKADYDQDRIICPTMFPAVRKEMYKGAPWRSCVKEESGHVVIKVYDEGKKYKVYFLDASNENMTVKAVYGPFVSKPKESGSSGEKQEQKKDSSGKGGMMMM
ncbi:MAG: hypothetical protein Q4G59_10925 [Planctomycetia bacterium]|nr:hypothetical protein [Planctomycetia bacterium]